MRLPGLVCYLCVCMYAHVPAHVSVYERERGTGIRGWVYVNVHVDVWEVVIWCLIMFMISVLSVCCCALLNFESFIHGHFLFLLLFIFIKYVVFCCCLFLGGRFACSFKWNKEVLSLTRQK